ncbi:MAG: hypothetical protein OEV92_05290 [Nitrospinota bacterium]|nr:hypothetical protein [Nitrospinota bacterium]
MALIIFGGFVGWGAASGYYQSSGNPLTSIMLFFATAIVVDAVVVASFLGAFMVHEWREKIRVAKK